MGYRTGIGLFLGLKGCHWDWDLLTGNEEKKRRASWVLQYTSHDSDVNERIKLRCENVGWYVNVQLWNQL